MINLILFIGLLESLKQSMLYFQCQECFAETLFQWWIDYKALFLATVPCILYTHYILHDLVGGKLLTIAHKTTGLTLTQTIQGKKHT